MPQVLPIKSLRQNNPGVAQKSRSEQSEAQKNNTRKKILVFFICLCISVLFWLMLALTRIYTTTVEVRINYINLPEKNILKKSLPTHAQMELRGTGFPLITYSLDPGKIAITLNGQTMGISPKKAYGNGFITTRHAIDDFNSMHEEVKAQRISPDTVFFSFFSKAYRKIPVSLLSEIAYASQYGPAGKIEITPQFIDVSGPDSLLNQLKYIETEKLELKGINQSGQFKVNINQPIGELNYAPAFVNVNIRVEKYTEIKLDVPVIAENLKNKDSVLINPSTVSVTGTVSLRNFSRINPGSFQVVANVDELKTNPEKKLKLYLRKYPAEMRDIRIIPDHVGCIIKRK